jgi:hypothetical protein
VAGLFGAAAVAASGASLRFYGHGVSAPDLDRVKIPLQTHRPVDVGGSFTIEFWLKAAAANNLGTVTTGNDGWITGNIILDRDVYGDGDSGDWGVALGRGRIASTFTCAGALTVHGRVEWTGGDWVGASSTTFSPSALVLFGGTNSTNDLNAGHAWINSGWIVFTNITGTSGLLFARGHSVISNLAEGVIEKSLALANGLKMNDTELPRLAEMFSLTGDVRTQIQRLAERQPRCGVRLLQRGRNAAPAGDVAWPVCRCRSPNLNENTPSLTK